MRRQVCSVSVVDYNTTVLQLVVRYYTVEYYDILQYSTTL